MSLRRIQTNSFSFLKREIFCISDMELIGMFQVKTHELTEKLDPNAVSLLDDRPISLSFRVSSLIELSQLYKAAQISRLAVLENTPGLNTEMMIRDEIIGAMCAAKRDDVAIALYTFFGSESRHVHSTISFNHILKAHCDEDRVEKALTQCNHRRSCFDGDVHSLRLLTKGLVKTGRIYAALGLVKYIRIWDSVLYSYLIRGFLDVGNHDKAYELFDEFNQRPMPGCHSRREILDATFVDYWLKQGEDERAMEIYRSILSRNGGQIVCADTGNTLLGILLDNGKQTEAWDLFNAMVTASKTFDRDTFGTMVNACFKLGRFKQALETFKRPEFTRSSRCYANIISQFCHRGMMSEALDLFEELRSHLYLRPDVATFRSMINGYAKAGRVHEAIAMLKIMAGATLLKFAVHQAR